MKRSFKFRAAISLLLATFSWTVAAEDEIRAAIRDRWLTVGMGELRALASETLTDRFLETYTVSQKRDGSGFVTVTVAPSASGSVRNTWVLYRRLSDGQADHIRLYPADDPDIFLELKPEGPDPERGRSQLSLSVYGGWACRKVTVAATFVRLYTASLEDIRDLSSATFPWYLLEADPARYRDAISAVARIRERLPSLVYLDDGAFDENGDPVHIADGSPQSPDSIAGAVSAEEREAGAGSLFRKRANVAGGVNCSGFAKWIVDGIIRPEAGAALFIPPLKEQTASPQTLFTEPYRASRDLFFALDWTRNLAAAALSLQSGRTVRPDASGVDVTLSALGEGVGYQKDVGYRAGEVLPLLYILAIREPGHLYLGAVSRERGVPNLRQYHHVAAFFPYFDSDGRFAVAVFESAVETPAGVFFRKNADAFINLVRIRIPEAGRFDP